MSENEEKKIKVEGAEPQTNNTTDSSQQPTADAQNADNANAKDSSQADTQADEKADEGNETQQEATTDAQTEEKDPLAEANAKVAELKDQYLRLAAEFDNYKKRTLREKTELILNGGQKTVTAILPVIDDMERALASKSDDPQAIREGVENIFKKFLKTLESLGVKPIDTHDKDFDTDFHEAVAMVPGMGDDKKGKVIDCLQTGYIMNDKVIRHAKVAVGQ